MKDFKHNTEENYIEIIQRLVRCVVILLIILVAMLFFILSGINSKNKEEGKHAMLINHCELIKDKVPSIHYKI